MTADPIRTPATPPDAREQQRLGQELPDDVAAGRAERPSQADLGSALEHRHQHHVGDAEAADEQRHRPKAEEQRGERRRGRGLRRDRPRTAG